MTMSVYTPDEAGARLWFADRDLSEVADDLKGFGWKLTTFTKLFALDAQSGDATAPEARERVRSLEASLAETSERLNAIEAARAAAVAEAEAGRQREADLAARVRELKGGEELETKGEEVDDFIMVRTTLPAKRCTLLA